VRRIGAPFMQHGVDDKGDFSRGDNVELEDADVPDDYGVTAEELEAELLLNIGNARVKTTAGVVVSTQGNLID
jgi:hypothetical protein